MDFTTGKSEMNCKTKKIEAANAELTCYVICYATFAGTHYLQGFDSTPLTESVMDHQEPLMRNCDDSIIELNDEKKWILSGYFFTYENLFDAITDAKELDKRGSEWIKHGVVRCKVQIGTTFAKGIYETEDPRFRNTRFRNVKCRTINVIATKAMVIDDLAWQ